MLAHFSSRVLSDDFTLTFLDDSDFFFAPVDSRPDHRHPLKSSIGTSIYTYIQWNMNLALAASLV